VIFEKYKNLPMNKNSLGGLMAASSGILFSYSTPEGYG